MLNRIQKTINQYNKIALLYAQNISRRIPQEEINYFAKLLKPHSKILDVGCAAGRDSRIFKDLGFDVIGIDLSEKLLEIAKRNNPDITFKKADFRSIPYPNDSFDGLWVNAVFHHIDREEMITALKEFRRVLKANGILYIRTKQGKGNWKGREELALNEEREFTLLSSKDLESMIKKIGLSKIELYSKKDKTRDLYWIILFCKKVNI